jgi:hypothetical protein
MSVETQVHAKSWEDAQKASAKLASMPGVTEEVKAAYAKALETHPGNPANAKAEDEPEPESEEDIAAKLEAEEIASLAAKYGSKEKVLEAVAKNEIDVRKAVKVMAHFDPPAASNGRLYCKVSAKGAVSIYGLQRQPVTLYAEQHERLAKFYADAENGPLAFIKAEEGKEHEAKEYKDGKATGRMIKCRITRKAKQLAA